MKRNARRRRQGFSLVEVSLALLVVGVGMMAVLALFPSGLDAAKRAQDETRAAFFADDAFDQYRTLFESGQDMSDPLSAALAPAPLGMDFWSDTGGRMAPRVTGTNWPGTGLATNVFTSSVAVARYAPNWQPHSPAQGIPEFAMRYRFELGADPSDPLHPSIRRARIRVWPGEFGPTTPDRAFTFYTEFYDWGM